MLMYHSNYLIKFVIYSQDKNNIGTSIFLPLKLLCCICLIGEKEKALIIITGNAIKSSIKQSGNHTEWSPSNNHL